MVWLWYGQMVTEFGLFIWWSRRSHLLKDVWFFSKYIVTYSYVYVSGFLTKKLMLCLLLLFFRERQFIYFISLNFVVAFLSDLEGAIEYLLGCGLERGSYTYQHSSNPLLYSKYWIFRTFKIFSTNVTFVIKLIMWSHATLINIWLYVNWLMQMTALLCLVL